MRPTPISSAPRPGKAGDADARAHPRSGERRGRAGLPPPGHDERRSRHRRRHDRARARRLRLLSAAVAGASVAIGLQALGDVADSRDPHALAARRGRPGLPASAEDAIGDDGWIAELMAVADAAELLTPADLTLEEATGERWLMRAADLERIVADPDAPAAAHAHARRGIAALERAGAISPRSPPDDDR